MTIAKLDEPRSAPATAGWKRALSGRAEELVGARDELAAMSKKFRCEIKLAACTNSDSETFYITSCGWMSESDAKILPEGQWTETRICSAMWRDDNNNVTEPAPHKT